MEIDTSIDETMDIGLGGGDSGLNLRLSVCSSQGGRKYMEDRVHVHCQRKPDGTIDYIFLGVYDGHGGSDASQYAKDHLRLAITDQKGFHCDDDETVLKAIKDGFLETHYGMWKTFETWPRTASGYPSTSGTTASIAIIKNNRVYIGHVGDSAVAIGNNDGSSLSGKLLTVDHKPDSPEEIKRICETGGEVMSKSGVMRVVWTRPSKGHQGPVRRSTSIEKIPFLAVARALGDLWSYNSVLDRFVVSPEPDVCVLPLELSHRCLILGSDGLWNVLKPDYAVELVNNYENEDAGSENVASSTTATPLEWNHARYLVKHALRRWGFLRADNISAITVIIDRPQQNSIADSNESGPFSAISTEPPVIEHTDLHIDSVLTVCPTALIRISDEKTQVIRTKQVDLSYNGASDLSHSLTSSAFFYKGPGYNPVRMTVNEPWSELDRLLDKLLICNKDDPRNNRDDVILSASGGDITKIGGPTFNFERSGSTHHHLSSTHSHHSSAHSHHSSAHSHHSSAHSHHKRASQEKGASATTTTSLSLTTAENFLIKLTATTPSKQMVGQENGNFGNLGARLSPRNSITQAGDQSLLTNLTNSNSKNKKMLHIIVTTPKRRRIMTDFDKETLTTGRMTRTTCHVTSRSGTITYKTSSGSGGKRRRPHFATVCSHSSASSGASSSPAFYNLRRSGRLLTPSAATNAVLPALAARDSLASRDAHSLTSRDSLASRDRRRCPTPGPPSSVAPSFDQAAAAGSQTSPNGVKGQGHVTNRSATSNSTNNRSYCRRRRSNAKRWRRLALKKCKKQFSLQDATKTARLLQY